MHGATILAAHTHVKTYPGRVGDRNSCRARSTKNALTRNDFHGLLSNWEEPACKWSLDTGDSAQNPHGALKTQVVLPRNETLECVRGGRGRAYSCCARLSC